MNRTDTAGKGGALNAAQRHLQVAEDYLSGAGQSVKPGCYMRDIEAPVYFWSPEVFACFGLAASERAPATEEMLQRIEPAGSKVLTAAVQRCVRERVGYDVEYRVILRDGSRRQLRSIGYAITSASGRGSAIVGTLTDLTAQRCACAALKSARAELRRLAGPGSDTLANSGGADGVRGGLSGAQRERLAEFIEANLAETPNLRQMAAVVGLSASHFARAFKQSTHQTPHQYVLALRLERARDAMARSAREPSALAFEFGFFDQSHFTRHFRRKFGVTPGEFLRTVSAQKTPAAALPARGL